MAYLFKDALKLGKGDYSQRKNLPFEVKVQLAKARILQFYDEMDGNVYVSFSGGLDSTVLLHLVRSVLGEDVLAVYSDTGLEYPEIRQFVKSFSNVKIIRPERSFVDVIKNEGYPIVSKETAAKVRKLRHSNLSERYRNYLLNGDERGKMGMLAKKWQFLINAPFDTSEKCCDIMKKAPFKKFHKETGLFPYLGITQDESFMRMNQYNATGCNIIDGKNPQSKPMGPWTHQDVLRYVVENNLEICSVYGNIEQDLTGKYYTTGEQRTGCMFCGFGCHMEQCPNRFQRMKETHPKQYNYCMKDIEEGGLGMGKVLDYIKVPH